MKLRSLVGAVLVGATALAWGDGFYIQTPKTVLRDSDHLRIEVHGVPQPADVYLLTRVGGKDFFVTPDPQGPQLSPTPVPIATNVTSSAILLDFPVGSLQGRYPAFVILTRVGGDPYNVHDWLGGFDGLRRVLFRANVDLDADRNGDGWLDWDNDHDGYFDDDDDFDGLPGIPGTGPSLGAQPYAQNCAGCHGATPDERARRATNDPGRIRNAIDQNRGGMGVLAGRLTDADLTAIASWLAQASGGTTGASGRDLYLTYCSGCHGADPQQDRRLGKDGTSLREIEEAIWENKGGMGQLRSLVGTDVLRAMADYLVGVVGFDT